MTNGRNISIVNIVMKCQIVFYCLPRILYTTFIYQWIDKKNKRDPHLENLKAGNVRFDKNKFISLNSQL